MIHRFYVEPDQVSASTEVRFSPAQAHQLRNVLRLRAGDHVQVFDGQHSCDWLIELTGPDAGRILGQRPHAPEPRTRLVAYPALLQRDKFEPVLQKLTELGAAGITPVLTERGLVREPPDDRRYERWRAIVREAAEQCGRGRLPELGVAAPFEHALREASGVRLVAYEAEHKLTLREALHERPVSVSVFVGPEGGFTSGEIDCAQYHNARVVTLGPRVLRTETASPVLAALVLYELGDLSWPEQP